MEILEILQKSECFTITEVLNQTKSDFELLTIINYLLYNIIDNIRYNIETEEEKKDFEELTKIKDKILNIKNKYQNI